jgi:hypothetical protein
MRIPQGSSFESADVCGVKIADKMCRLSRLRPATRHDALNVADGYAKPILPR